MSTKRLLKKCKERLIEHYGARLADVLLYGSEARGEARDDSDIDLLILLQGDFDFFKELRVIVDLLYPLQLESDRHISAKPAALDEYEQGAIQFYRNVLMESTPV